MLAIQDSSSGRSRTREIRRPASCRSRTTNGSSGSNTSAFSYVVSLGSICFTARFLEGQGLRTCKYPFDWLYSSAYLVRHALRNKFEKFLNKKCYFRAKSGLLGDDRVVRKRPAGKAAPRRIRGGKSGTGHTVYSSMMLGSKKQTLWPHHDMLGKGGEDLASHERAVGRLQTVLGQKNKKTLFILTQRVASVTTLAAARVREDPRSPAVGAKIPAQTAGGPRLGSIAEIMHLFGDLKEHMSGPFHLDAVFLVVPPASEASNVAFTRKVCTQGKGTASLAIYEQHCVGENTGLYFKDRRDNVEFGNLIKAKRKFQLAKLDDTSPVGYSDSSRPRARSSQPPQPRASASGRSAKARARTRIGTPRTGGQLSLAVQAAVDPNQKLKIQKFNPKKKGSAAYKRYEKYKIARTSSQFLQLGGCLGDLRHDHERGYLKFR